jgi:uncharacterized SAM-dependent methyltransferase
MTSALFDEVLRRLKPDLHRPGYFLLNEPHLLYLSDEQSELYLDAMKSEDYSSSFHGPTVAILKANLDAIFADVGRAVSLIDLGPGYPDKSLPIVAFLKGRGIACTYVPVDISRKFLDLAAGTVAPLVERVCPVHAMFEACAGRIPPEIYRDSTYCMIGLTFMNFPPDDLLPLLKRLARDRGRVIVATELLTAAKTPEVILRSYRTDEARAVGFGPLEHLGLREGDVSYCPAFVNGRVELQYTLRRAPSGQTELLPLKAGHTVVTAVSYRYTRAELVAILERHFAAHRIFESDDGGAAVAVGED